MVPPGKSIAQQETNGASSFAAGNVDCPTCGDHVKVLASELPMSHHVNSTIVCRISGQVMDSENEPLSFPNGYVYSAKVSLVSHSFACDKSGV